LASLFADGKAYNSGQVNAVSNCSCIDFLASLLADGKAYNTISVARSATVPA